MSKSWHSQKYSQLLLCPNNAILLVLRTLAQLFIYITSPIYQILFPFIFLKQPLLLTLTLLITNSLLINSPIPTDLHSRNGFRWVYRWHG